jgi:hypothetical protein
MLITHQHITKRSIAAATTVAAGLTGFLLLSDPGGGARDAPLFDWLAASAITVASCTALVSVAARLRPASKAALRGAAAGLAFALGAALIKDVVTRLEAQGLEAAIADWHFYAAIAAAVATIALNQAALQAGVLAPAVTASVTLNAGGSVALGVLIFSEQLQASPGAVAGSFVSFGLMIVGVLVLAQQEEHDPRAIGASPHAEPVTEPGPG